VNKTILRRFLDNPARRWAVIFAILGIGLTAVLPAADELNKSRRDRTQLEQLAARMRSDVAGLERVRSEATRKREGLGKLEALAVAGDQVPVFRQEIVDWAREAGCQVRRVRLDSPRSQGWHEGGSLFELSSARRTKLDSPYVLQMQPLSVSVSGTLSKVRQLLNKLHSTDRLIQCRSLSVCPSRDDRREVVLNVELVLFGLTRAEEPAGSARNTKGDTFRPARQRPGDSLKKSV
jgi:Tfp pilus assembly protein PilO